MGMSQQDVSTITTKAIASTVEKCYSYGLDHYAGRGVPKNLKLAVRFFEIAAKQGYANAQFALATCYKNGEGVPKDEKAAREWFQIAIQSYCKTITKDLNNQGSWQCMAIASKSITDKECYRIGYKYYYGTGAPRNLAFAKAKKAAIQISYRDEGNGGGAFFDHYTIQKATGYTTEVFVSPRMETTALQSYIKTNDHKLPLGIHTEDGKKMPKVTDINASAVGLLVIPGRARETETKRKRVHEIRHIFEQTIISDAIRRGRPIIAICAGSWQLWSAYGGRMMPVHHHNYGGGMPRIGVNGNIVSNIQIHDISINPNSLFNRIVKKERLSVNSVHWMAPDVGSKPAILTVSAIAARNGTEINSRDGTGLMKPDEATIEVFETEVGAPVMGIQYHPEAYNKADKDSTSHHALLLYMAKAGDAYNQKQEMLDEFRNKYKPH